jgi:hypothetical protein
MLVAYPCISPTAHVWDTFIYLFTENLCTLWPTLEICFVLYFLDCMLLVVSVSPEVVPNTHQAKVLEDVIYGTKCL